MLSSGTSCLRLNGISLMTNQAKQQGLTCYKIPFDFVNAQVSWMISTYWYHVDVLLWERVVEKIILEEGFFVDSRGSKCVRLIHHSGMT